MVGPDQEKNCYVDLGGAAVSWAISTQRCYVVHNIR